MDGEDVDERDGDRGCFWGCVGRGQGILTEL